MRSPSNARKSSPCLPQLEEVFLHSIEGPAQPNQISRIKKKLGRLNEIRHEDSDVTVWKALLLESASLEPESSVCQFTSHETLG